MNYYLQQRSAPTIFIPVNSPITHQASEMRNLGTILPLSPRANNSPLVFHIFSSFLQPISRFKKLPFLFWITKNIIWGLYL